MIQIDLPMPTNCYDCKFSDDSGDYPYCWVLHQNRGYSFDRRMKRFPNCPLKPAEKPEEDDEKDKLKKLCRVLFNRCRVVGSGDGVLCGFCGMRTECDEMCSVIGAKRE